jgi:hypothetical protein
MVQECGASAPSRSSKRMAGFTPESHFARVFGLERYSGIPCGLRGRGSSCRLLSRGKSDRTLGHIDLSLFWASVFSARCPNSSAPLSDAGMIRAAVRTRSRKRLPPLLYLVPGDSPGDANRGTKRRQNGTRKPSTQTEIAYPLCAGRGAWHFLCIARRWRIVPRSERWNDPRKPKSKSRARARSVTAETIVHAQSCTERYQSVPRE